MFTTEVTVDNKLSCQPVTGYTGTIPSMTRHFGKPYRAAVDSAMLDFQHHNHAHVKIANPFLLSALSHPQTVHVLPKNERSPKPIQDQGRSGIPSGYTGYVPRNRVERNGTTPQSGRPIVEQSMQSTLKSNRQAPASASNVASTKMESKDITSSRPIVGYLGHIPMLHFQSDKGFQVLSNKCLDEYAVKKAQVHPPPRTIETALF